MSAQRRRGKVRRRVVVGGAAAGVVALALLIGGLFKGLGFGKGGGETGPGKQNTSPKAARDSSNPKPVQAGDVVNVRIEGHGYYVEQPGGGTAAVVSLERLKELVRTAPGNKQGFRVRIKRGATSTPRTESRLEDALHSMRLLRDKDYRFIE